MFDEVAIPILEPLCELSAAVGHAQSAILQGEKKAGNAYLERAQELIEYLREREELK